MEDPQLNPEDESPLDAPDHSGNGVLPGQPDAAPVEDAPVEEAPAQEAEEASDLEGSEGSPEEDDSSDDTSDDTSEGTSDDTSDDTSNDEEQDVEASSEDALAAAVDGAFDELAPEAAEQLADAEAEADDDELVDDWQPGDWYVVHTYAGYENKVKTDLETRVASMNMEDKIYEVVIPMEEVLEVKGGKKQMVQRKVFPGYLLVRLDFDPDSWYVVRNTPGVTGFVGSGNKPIPLTEREVDKILQRKGEAEKPKPRLEWQVEDPVRVTTGPFANFQGVIHEVDEERQKVKVLVNIFGRETPVELSMNEIAKV